jgi:hypothetical protein
MSKMCYAVIETDSKIILFFAPSRLTATALAQGMLNTKAVEFPIHPEFDSESIKQVDPKYDIIQLQSAGYKVQIRRLTDFAGALDCYKKRDLLEIRSRYLHALELLCVSQLTRSTNLIDESLGTFVHEQLNKSDPQSDHYTPALLEYANTVGIDPDIAYQELSIRTQSAGLIKFRVQALYDKYSRILTTLSDSKQFESVIFQMKNQLYLDSYV